MQKKVGLREKSCSKGELRRTAKEKRSIKQITKGKLSYIKNGLEKVKCKNNAEEKMAKKKVM